MMPQTIHLRFPVVYDIDSLSDSCIGCELILIALSLVTSHHCHCYPLTFHQLPSICLYGGTPKWEQQKQLKAEHPRIVVGTPGRVLDLLQDGSLDLYKVNYAVLDEADRMLDMGFLPSVTDIFGYLPSPDKRQSLMFSATWNKEVRRLSRKLLLLLINIHDDLMDLPGELPSRGEYHHHAIIALLHGL
mmetsp:Transcript_4254/g.3852  ORF Transcript_4254/g.3852 Transcript_4254/m.3852 type:complete len:188 (+) Transcript_4254:2-565(+)